MVVFNRRVRLFLFIVVVFAARVFAETMTITLPPDPNALPVFVLMEKKAQFLPEDEIALIEAPAGDPSAMRAMIQAKKMDFAFFNIVGGANFIANGMKQVKLIGPWVWKGVYLLMPVETRDLATLNGKRVLVAPSLSTPPHIINQKALGLKGIKPQFLAGGSGAALFGQLSQPSKAPSGVVAPEPVVSMILAKQKADGWPQQWRIAFEPTESLGGTIPLGALWQVHGGVSAAARGRLVEALDKAAAYTADPANRAEVAAIGSAGYARLFKNPIPAPVFAAILESGRVEWRLDRSAGVKRTVLDYLKNVFGISMDASIFIE
ncbi:MAG: hypothetical protein JXM71_12495 [Spirochaetales bacterium]|nr:hypothetical protein [Spirochaetales bacterium]